MSSIATTVSHSSTHSLPPSTGTGTGSSTVTTAVDSAVIPSGVVIARGVPLNNSIIPTTTVVEDEDIEAKLALGKSYVVEKGMSVAQAAMEADVSYYKLAK